MKKSIENNTTYNHFTFDNADDNFQILIDGIPLGFALCELIYDEVGKVDNYKFLAVNSNFDEESGLLGTNVLGRSIKEVNPTIEQEGINSFIQVILNEKNVEFSEFGFFIDRLYEINAFLVENNKFVILFKDITEKQRSNEVLRKSHSRFEQLFNSMFEMFMLIELIYDDNGDAIDFRYLKVNPAFERSVKMKSEELIGKTALEVNGIVEDYWIKTYERVDKSGIPQYSENYSAEIKKYYQINAWKTEEGKVAIFLMDITERKYQELELLKAKEEAKESDRLKSAFLANMSHEIRTPLNGIVGFTSLLKKTGNTPEQVKEYTSIINSSCDRVLNTINDIIDISKIESGVMKLNMGMTNLNDHIEFIYVFFKPQAEAKGLEFSSNCPLLRSEANIYCDSEKIYAILTNLMKNAIKFTHEGSIKLGYLKKGDYIEFYVEDTGIGIDSDATKNIFERFVQVENYDTQVNDGSGLGLSISKAFVEMMGGQISVKSVFKKGSRFIFTLPHQITPDDEGASSGDEDNDNSTLKKRLKIVVADDDEISNYLLTILLRSKNHTLLQARDGQQALNFCRNNDDINLVLMDIRMPLLNGYEATKKIREFNKNIVIIAQTAYGLSGDKEKAIDAGCNDYLTKPIDEDELFRLIDFHFML